MEKWRVDTVEIIVTNFVQIYFDTQENNPITLLDESNRNKDALKKHKRLHNQKKHFWFKQKNMVRTNKRIMNVTKSQQKEFESYHHDGNNGESKVMSLSFLENGN